jgi:hypothetical protein
MFVALSPLPNLQGKALHRLRSLQSTVDPRCTSDGALCRSAAR